MENEQNINNIFLSKLVEKSLFTNRQIQIIYNFKNKEKRLKGISSGAYYREVKQSKMKLRKLFYSILLLNLINVMNNDQITALNSMLNKLRILENNHVKYHDKEIDRVINVIEDLINRIVDI
ncbi:MAG: hypothetical protein M3Q77_06090 [Thermoproteota archaeon]|nr:hypothetical protein [Thermoproteota archaeon]